MDEGWWGRLRCPGTSTHDDVVPLPTLCALCAFAVLEPPAHDDVFSISANRVHPLLGPFHFPLNHPKVGRNPLNTPNHLSILTTGTSSNYCVLVASTPRSAILQNKIRAKRKEHPIA